MTFFKRKSEIISFTEVISKAPQWWFGGWANFEIHTTFFLLALGLEEDDKYQAQQHRWAEFKYVLLYISPQEAKNLYL